MNFALILGDKGLEKSFYVKDGLAYDSNGKPHMPRNSLPKIFRNIWNIPLAFEGRFINYFEGLPNIDLDVILAVQETKNNNFFSDIRKKYKNALIIGYAKEIHPLFNLNNNFIEFLKKCDKVAMPYIDSTIAFLSKIIRKKIYPLYYPYPVKTLSSLYPRKEKEFILIGCNSWDKRRGYANCLTFANKLSKKYNIPILENKANLTWHKWLTKISECKLCLNMDTSPKLGQVPIECAILNTPHLGSVSDASEVLWPKTATNNQTELENLFLNYNENWTKQAYQKAIERHSFETAGILLNNIINN